MTPPLSDAVLALVFVVVGQVDVWNPWGDEFPRGGFDGPSALNAALVLLYTGPVAWRRRAPLPALALMIAAALVQLAFVSPTVLFFGGLLPAVVMAYSVALHERSGRDFLGLGIGVAGLAVASQTWRAARLRPAKKTRDHAPAHKAWCVAGDVGAADRMAAGLLARGGANRVIL